MKKFRLLLLLFLFILSIGCVFFVNNKLNKKDLVGELININELSDDFMNEYYKGTEEIINGNNSDNVLIVVAKRKPKNTYGAKRVVNAPNSTYILEYGSEADKYEAKKKFENDEKVYSVIENRKYYFSNEGSKKTYNSWGIEKAGLNNAINILKEKGGKNVTVAIIDTGVDLDLFNDSYEGKIEEVHNLFDTDVYDNNTMFDHFGHGTHIAGTIAEGTADNVKILPVKVSDSNSIEII